MTPRSNIRPLLLGCAFWLVTLSAVGAEPFSLNGHALGDRLDDVLQDARFDCDGKAGCFLYEVCTFVKADAAVFKGAPVDALVLYFTGERLSGIAASFAENQFDQVIRALMDEYGPGDMETAKADPAAGGRPGNAIYVWRERSKLLRVERFQGGEPRSSVIISEKNFLSELVAP